MSRTHILFRSIYADLKDAQTPDDIIHQLRLLQLKFINKPEVADLPTFLATLLQDKQKYSNLKVGKLVDVLNTTTKDLADLKDRGLNENSTFHFFDQTHVYDSISDIQDIGQTISDYLVAHPIITNSDQLQRFLYDLSHHVNIAGLKNIKDVYNQFKQDNQSNFDEVLAEIESNLQFISNKELYGFLTKHKLLTETALPNVLHFFTGKQAEHLVAYDEDTQQYSFLDSDLELYQKLIQALIDNISADDDCDCDYDTDEDEY